MSRRALLRVGVVTVLGLVAALGMWGPAISQQGEDGKPVEQRLLDLLTKSRDLTYHVRYDVTSSDEEVAASDLWLEVWRQGRGSVRHDAGEQGPSSRAETRLLRRSGQLTRCQRFDTDPWSCDDGAGAGLEAFDDVVAVAKAAMDGAAVTEQARTVRGTDLRCFVIARFDGTPAMDICTDVKGVPLQILSADARIDWQEYTQGFDRKVFDAPATRGRRGQQPPPSSAPVAAPSVPQPLTLQLSGHAPLLEIPVPGTTVLSCNEGAATSWGFADAVDLEPALGEQPGLARVGLDVKPTGAGAFLLPDQSAVTFSTQHGAVRLDLHAGDCGSGPLAWDGTTTSGTGTWTVDDAYTTDGYRQATGSGTFDLTATFGPERTNPWTLSLDGQLTVLSPALRIQEISSHWGALGADYAGRVLTVVFRITNTGPGDAFRTLLQTPTTPDGIAAIEARPSVLGDLSPGESVDVTVRYRVGLRGARKGPLLIQRAFDGTVPVTVHDALDVEHALSLPVHVVAPLRPPAL